VATIPSLQAYRWELGASEARAAGVRISAKRERSPLVLSPEQASLAWQNWNFGISFWCFWKGLGNSSRQNRCAPLAGVRLREHELQRSTLVLLASGCEPERKCLQSCCRCIQALKHSLQEWKSQSLYNKPEDFVFPSERLQGRKPLDLAPVLKRRLRPAFRRIACGLAHFSTLGWNRAGRNGRTSTHDPRLLAAQQPPCNDQIPAGDFEDQTAGTGQIGRRYFADGYLPKTNLIQ
jgi:hypothetical protein